MEPIPIKLLFAGDYLDGTLQVVQSKLDKSHIMFSFKSFDMSFSGEVTILPIFEDFSHLDMVELMNEIAKDYFERLMYTKAEAIKNGYLLH